MPIQKVWVIYSTTNLLYFNCHKPVTFSIATI